MVEKVCLIDQLFWNCHNGCEAHQLPRFLMKSDDYRFSNSRNCADRDQLKNWMKFAQHTTSNILIGEAKTVYWLLQERKFCILLRYTFAKCRCGKQAYNWMHHKIIKRKLELHNCLAATTFRILTTLPNTENRSISMLHNPIKLDVAELQSLSRPQPFSSFKAH